MTRALKKINHVGLAAPDIEAFLRKTTPLYEGFSRGPMIVNERQKVRELYMTDGATTVELLEPLGELTHRHRQVSQEQAWWSRVGQVNGRDADALRSDLCRPSLPR
jgi:hypothetical protein